MQYFAGLEGYCSTAPFDPSMMVHFHKRRGEEALRKCNEFVVKHGCKSIKKIIAATEDLQFEKESQELIDHCDLFSQCEECNTSDSNRGTLLIDTTCVPADIRYPIDLSLLNEALELTETLIDRMRPQVRQSFGHKPQTYRQQAREQFLAVAQKKRPRIDKIRAPVQGSGQLAATIGPGEPLRCNLIPGCISVIDCTGWTPLLPGFQSRTGCPGRSGPSRPWAGGLPPLRQPAPRR